MYQVMKSFRQRFGKPPPRRTTVYNGRNALWNTGIRAEQQKDSKRCSLTDCFILFHSECVWIPQWIVPSRWIWRFSPLIPFATAMASNAVQTWTHLITACMCILNKPARTQELPLLMFWPFWHHTCHGRGHEGSSDTSPSVWTMKVPTQISWNHKIQVGLNDWIRQL